MTKFNPKNYFASNNQCGDGRQQCKLSHDRIRERDAAKVSLLGKMQVQILIHWSFRIHCTIMYMCMLYFSIIINK